MNLVLKYGFWLDQEQYEPKYLLAEKNKTMAALFCLELFPNHKSKYFVTSVERLRTFSNGPPLPDPVGDVADKVKEEVTIGNRNDFVHHLDKETESLRRLHIQSLRDSLTQVGRSGGGFHDESLKA